MKAFLWHQAEKVSENYHDNGSVLIEADSLERAKELAVIDGWNDKKIKMKLGGEPDLELDSPSDKEKVWVFPDAGCC